MINTYHVIDDFCDHADRVRESALEAGFSTWLPKQGAIGSSRYNGVGFWADHAHMLASLATVMGTHVLPNTLFLRVSLPEDEGAYVHSDRTMGAYTCVAYLSHHDDDTYGTAFYRHRATGLTEMPPIGEVMNDPRYAQLREDMTSGGEKEWEQTDFVGGKYNRAVIFHAPLFHARIPHTGLGTHFEDGRMVWVAHFHTPFTLAQHEGRSHD